MLKKIYLELVQIRKELQAIRSSKESNSKVKYVRENGRVVKKHTELNEQCNPNTTLGRII